MLKKILKCFISIILIVMIIILVINILVITTTKDQIKSLTAIKDLNNIDCILILGASIRENYPSPMLEDRLKQGISLYQEHKFQKILVSGDHISDNYDEVNVMKDYLVAHQIPSQDVFMDHAGISTYDSIYRAKYIFQAQKIIIVTQQYHLYRALYIANQLEIEAYGVAANLRTYTNQEQREIREILARTKDFFKSILKMTSTYLGQEVSLEENGDLTNDSK